MNDTLKNVLAVIIGIVVGNLVNGGIIQLSNSIIPYPEGYDMSSMEGITSTLHLLEPKHFIMPWLAHAMGTFLGAFVTVKLAATNHLQLALGVATVFFIFGLIMVFMVPDGPIWFSVVDLLGAYIPMGWLAHRLGKRTTL